MNKKKLPRAITRTADDMREAAAAPGPAGPPAELALTERCGAPGSAPEAARIDALPEVAPSAAQSLAPEIEAHPRSDLVPVRAGQEWRQRRAVAIVERYANVSALGGVIPLPLVNVAAVTAIILRMVKALSDLYGVPFQKDRAHAIVLGLIGGLTPTAVSTMTASTLVYFVPGSNLIGLAAASVSASGCARKIGWLFIRHFETGATLLDFPVPKRR